MASESESTGRAGRDIPAVDGLEGEEHRARLADERLRVEPDLVRGPIRSLVLRLALPVLGEQLLTSFVGIFDTFLAGRISNDALSAVGLAAYVSWLGSLLFSLVGTGTTALVARSWGASRRAEANRFCNQSMTLAAFLGVCCFVVFFLSAPTFASLQRMQGETFRIAVRYLRLDGLGLAFMSVCFVGGAALRGIGDMRRPMYIFAAMNVVNVAASVLLAFGCGPVPALGVDGIVGGTIVARAFGLLLILLVLNSHWTGLRLRARLMRVEWSVARRILRVGFPAASNGVILWLGHFAFLMVIASLAPGELGQAYFAAHIICVRVEALTYLPAMAWGAAAATLVGQALGAADHERAMQVGDEAAKQCALLALLSGMLFLLAAEPIYWLMSQDELVRRIGPPPFRFVALFQPLLAISIVYIASLRGAGDTRSPLLITLVGILFTRLPLSYLCGVVWHGGLFGAWVGMCSDMALRGILAALTYRLGRWLRTEV